MICREEGAAAAVDVELISLRCAPLSSANRAFPKSVWVAVAELRAVMATTFSRHPRLIIYDGSRESGGVQSHTFSDVVLSTAHAAAPSIFIGIAGGGGAGTELGVRQKQVTGSTS